MKKILLVDGDPQTRIAIRQQLSDEGYEVSEAENGEIAVEKIKNELPEVVLLDVMLPDMTGFQICQQVLSTPQSDLVYFIMMSIVPEVDHRVRGFEKGADEYISKPVNMQELVGRVKEGLERISTRREAAIEPLTKLYNHSFFRVYLAQEVIRAQRYHHALTFIMGDIDTPDQIAEKPDGNTVLEEIGEILRKHCRRSDIPVRWEDEKFGVLAHETDLMGGMMLAERIRQTIETSQLAGDAQLTMSFGVATLKTNKEDLIKWAKTSLEKAQKTGGNKVVSATNE